MTVFSSFRVYIGIGDAKLQPMLKVIFLFTSTAAAEIFGCYVLYACLKMGRPLWWLVPGTLSLAIFAWLLTLHPTIGAGRIYAGYGGIYVAMSLIWLWLVEGSQPDRWDVAGSILCVLGTVVILLGPRWEA
jgi:small multidrug resistance family-3 protein